MVAEIAAQLDGAALPGGQCDRRAGTSAPANACTVRCVYFIGVSGGFVKPPDMVCTKLNSTLWFWDADIALKWYQFINLSHSIRFKIHVGGSMIVQKIWKRDLRAVKPRTYESGAHKGIRLVLCGFKPLSGFKPGLKNRVGKQKSMPGEELACVRQPGPPWPTCACCLRTACSL